jgi:hypothetical protein
VCYSYGLGTSTCSGFRDGCSANATLSLSSNFGVAGNRITAADVSALRAGIINLIGAFNTWKANHSLAGYPVSDPGAASTGQTISHSYINYLDSTLAAISDVQSGSVLDNPGFSTSQASVISHNDWNTILNAYNVVRQDCICNTDCSCNLQCTCNGNCGCNYSSDERLKTDIKLLRVVDGLNIYSFTYLWDKTKSFVGVMAHELLDTKYSHAVLTDRDGFYSVDYSKLPAF